MGHDSTCSANGDCGDTLVHLLLKLAWLRLFRGEGGPPTFQHLATRDPSRAGPLHKHLIDCRVHPVVLQSGTALRLGRTTFTTRTPLTRGSPCYHQIAICQGEVLNFLREPLAADGQIGDGSARLHPKMVWRVRHRLHCCCWMVE